MDPPLPSPLVLAAPLTIRCGPSFPAKSVISGGTARSSETRRVCPGVHAAGCDAADQRHAHGMNTADSGTWLLGVLWSGREQVLESNPDQVALIHAKHERARLL